MSYIETLNVVMRDVWTRDMTGGLDVQIVQGADSWQMVLIVGDERGHTRIPLDPPLFTNAQDLVAYLDSEIEKAVQHYRQPLREYPQTSAADAMEYLTA